MLPASTSDRKSTGRRSPRAGILKGRMCAASALEQMNLKLAHVVSDISGLTGMGIIKAILSGERDPAKLAKLRDPRVTWEQAGQEAQTFR